MKIKTLNAQSLLSICSKSDKLTLEAGSADAHANHLSHSNNPEPHSLVFISDEADLEKALTKRSSILVCLKKSLNQLPALQADQCLFSTTDIRWAMAEILPFVYDRVSQVTPGIASTAIIHPTAKISKNARIGEYCVIAAEVLIEDDVVIFPHCAVEKSAQIGKGTILQSHVVIGAHCQVGKFCQIHSFTVIGSDGFGYYTDPQHQHKKIPQMGIVILEDNVEIGANCSIDRATIDSTHIGFGSKIDNQVHIAHNCRIGKNCMITAGFRVAGSTTIGDNFVCGGGVLVTDHIHIANNVMVAGNSGVSNDIRAAGAYGGYPLQPIKDAMKTIASFAHLPEMRKQLHQIRKHLNLK